MRKTSNLVKLRSRAFLSDYYLHYIAYCLYVTGTNAAEHNSDSGDDDDVDSFGLPCRDIGQLRSLNAEIKESKERRKQLVSTLIVCQFHFRIPSLPIKNPIKSFSCTPYIIFTANAVTAVWRRYSKGGHQISLADRDTQ